MKANEIKVGHIYYVDYNPVKAGEFGKQHMGIVLRKNENEITFVTIPLTSNEMGKNKINLGKLECLPERLRKKESYAVLDQIRTVSSKRFEPIYDDTAKRIDAIVPKELLIIIYKAAIKAFLKDVDAEDVIKIFLS